MSSYLLTKVQVVLNILTKTLLALDPMSLPFTPPSSSNLHSLGFSYSYMTAPERPASPNVGLGIRLPDQPEGGLINRLFAVTEDPGERGMFLDRYPTNAVLRRRQDWADESQLGPQPTFAEDPNPSTASLTSVPALFSPLPTVLQPSPKLDAFQYFTINPSTHLEAVTNTQLLVSPAPSEPLTPVPPSPSTLVDAAVILRKAHENQDYVMTTMALSIALGVIVVLSTATIGFLLWNRPRKLTSRAAQEEAKHAPKDGYFSPYNASPDPSSIYNGSGPFLPELLRHSPSPSTLALSQPTTPVAQDVNVFSPPNNHHFQAPSPLVRNIMKSTYTHRPPPLVIIPRPQRQTWASEGPSTSCSYPPATAAEVRVSAMLSPSLPLSAVGGWRSGDRGSITSSQACRTSCATMSPPTSPHASFVPFQPVRQNGTETGKLQLPMRPRSHTVVGLLRPEIPYLHKPPMASPYNGGMDESPQGSPDLSSSSNSSSETHLTFHSFLAVSDETMTSHSTGTTMSSLSFNLADSERATMTTAVARIVTDSPRNSDILKEGCMIRGSSESSTAGAEELLSVDCCITKHQNEEGDAAYILPLDLLSQTSHPRHSISTVSGVTFDIVGAAPFVVIKCPPDEVSTQVVGQRERFSEQWYDSPVEGSRVSENTLYGCTKNEAKLAFGSNENIKSAAITPLLTAFQDIAARTPDDSSAALDRPGSTTSTTSADTTTSS